MTTYQKKTEMKAKKTTEERTSDVILQEPIEVVVGGRTYKVAPPCGATLIRISKYITGMPQMDFQGNRLNETLAFAKDCGCMYDIVATLILGAKAIRKMESRIRLFGRSNPYDVLVDELKYDCTNAQVFEIASKILAEGMEVNDFFALSASLREISLIQTTRTAADNKTTQSGPSSQAS